MSSGSVLRDLRGVLSWPIGRGVPHPSGCAVLPTQLLILGPHDHHTAGTVSCNQCCIPSAIWALCCLQHSVVPRGQTNLAMWNYHCIPVITQHVYVMIASDQRLEQAKAWDEVMSGTLHTSLCLGLQVPFYFVVDWATIVDIASPALFSLQCCSLEVNGRAHLNIHTHHFSWSSFPSHHTSHQCMQGTECAVHCLDLCGAARTTEKDPQVF